MVAEVGEVMLASGKLGNGGDPPEYDREDVDVPNVDDIVLEVGTSLRLGTGGRVSLPCRVEGRGIGGRWKPSLSGTEVLKLDEGRGIGGRKYEALPERGIGTGGRYSAVSPPL